MALTGSATGLNYQLEAIGNDHAPASNGTPVVFFVHLCYFTKEVYLLSLVPRLLSFFILQAIKTRGGLLGG